MMIPLENRDTYEDKLRRQGYTEDAIMMMSFTRMLMQIEDNDKSRESKEKGA
ncbi:MAG: hypothetical protein Unbinned4409contig1001_51 [Prokaryotic dsDNA virus sp.]|nr:MAG: hypothetical protein Unbinned4409contig1001_51 [Prokaryotic dsDNA virus sp.]